MRQLGPPLLVGWVRDYIALSLFTVAHTLLRTLAQAVPALRRSWRVRRLLDALRWGAGLDYSHDGSSSSGGGSTTPAPAAAPAAVVGPAS